MHNQGSNQAVIRQRAAIRGAAIRSIQDDIEDIKTSRESKAGSMAVWIQYREV